MRLTAVVAGAVLCVGAALPALPAAAEPWAPAATATIKPGVQTFTEGAQCTANFVFTSGTDVFIGQAAHCSGTGGATETDGCLAGSHPINTPVRVTGASRPGTMVYNSWLTMQSVNEKDQNACDYNDFALIRIDPADHGKVNPSVPFWGGPTGLDRNGSRLGESVLSYGNSGLRFGLSPLSPKQGVSLGTGGGGWTHTVYTATPGIPGDSGSAFLSPDGTALGVLSTVALLPLPLSNGVSDLAKMLDYAAANGRSVTLATGTEAFTGPLP
ncbi:MAG TPA: serine protease [Mycobacteriales bacterium]|nr:serine protease [Mycobacteriales bacterium]